MPRRAKKPCAYPGCPELVEAGQSYCEKHRKQRHKNYSRYIRDQATRKFYGAARWRKVRDRKIKQDPLCEECIKQNIITPATEVHHIKPVKNYPDLALRMDNLMSLCHSCHMRIEKEQGSHMPQVTIISGPPGSGKTTYVREHMREGDLIIDLDWIWQALTGLKYYNKPPGILPFVLAARDGILSRLERPSDIYRAWVVTGAPRASEREELAQRFNAKVIVLEVDVAECMRRIMKDDRRSNLAEHWRPLVEKWWRNYKPRDGDEVIRG